MPGRTTIRNKFTDCRIVSTGLFRAAPTDMNRIKLIHPIYFHNNKKT